MSQSARYPRVGMPVAWASLDDFTAPDDRYTLKHDLHDRYSGQGLTVFEVIELASGYFVTLYGNGGLLRVGGPMNGGGNEGREPLEVDWKFLRPISEASFL